MISEDPYGEIQMLVAELPDSARSIVSKSKEFRHAGEIDLALMLLDRAVATVPVPMLLAEKADLYAAEERFDEALDVSLQAVVRDPTNVSARYVLRRVLVGALPGAVEYLMQISKLFAEEDEVDFAEDLLRAAVDAHPDEIPLRRLLANFYMERGRLSSCIVELQGLLRVDPDNLEAQVMIAAAMADNGDASGAQRWLRKARAGGATTRMLARVEAKLAD